MMDSSNRKQTIEGLGRLLMTKEERIAREIVTLCVGNPDEPEVPAVADILRRAYGSIRED